LQELEAAVAAVVILVVLLELVVQAAVVMEFLQLDQLEVELLTLAVVEAVTDHLMVVMEHLVAEAQVLL
tara:strand:+ start:672 stop:878 length:207 start_codon:yes stop_codon:yes gene_type:complete